MSTRKKQKYFVNQQETITIQCRACGRSETFPVELLKNGKHSGKVNCACTETFDIELEFRKDYRKKTSINATLRTLSTPKKRARRCTIVDQSENGLLLRLAEELPIKEDDQLIVSFPAENNARRSTERIIKVRHCDLGLQIGGTFIDNSARRGAVSKTSTFMN